MIFLTLVVALLLDRIFAEPKRWHPLVGFGRFATSIEVWLNHKDGHRLAGVWAYLIAVLPWVAVAGVIEWIVQGHFIADWLVSAVILYLAIGWQSLLAHARDIALPLLNRDLPTARLALAKIVSRDCENLDETGVAKGATESVLENGADAIFAAIFWFALLGIPGVIWYRLSNTLDAMWGYKTERFLTFGWCAARMDDVLNFFPARLTALSYALMGNFQQAWRCWREQGTGWKSPNAGPVMAAGAGALDVSLGGEAPYQQQLQTRPVLGPLESEQTRANASAILAACALVNRSLALWLGFFAAIAWL